MNAKKAALAVLSIILKIVVLALAILFLMKLGSAAYHYGHSIFQQETVDNPPGRQVTVTIAASDSITDIGKKLQEKGLIEDWKLFYLQCRASAYYKTLQPGEYTLRTSYTPDQMMMIMSGLELELEEEDEDS